MQTWWKSLTTRMDVSFMSFRRHWRNEKAQTLGEYGLILLLIALIAIVGLMLIGNTNSDLITSIANAL